MKIPIRVMILIALIAGIGLWIQPTEAATGRIIGNYHVKYADPECILIRSISVDHEVTGHTIGDDRLLDFYYLLIHDPFSNPILSVRLHVFVDNTTSGPFDLVPAGDYPRAKEGTYEVYLLDIWQRTADPVLSPEELQDAWNDGRATEKASSTFQLKSIVNDGWYNSATGQWEDCPETTGNSGGGGGVDNIDQPGFTDGRLQHDRLVLYNERGPYGEPALHIYCVDDGSQGHLWMTLTQDQLQEVLERAFQIAKRRGAVTEIDIGNYFYPDFVANPFCPDRYWISAHIIAGQKGRDFEFQIRLHDRVEHKIHGIAFNYLPLTEGTANKFSFYVSPR